MTDYLALGICLILSVAWVGSTAGLICALRQAERDDLNQRDAWHTKRGEW